MRRTAWKPAAAAQRPKLYRRCRSNLLKCAPACSLSHSGFLAVKSEDEALQQTVQGLTFLLKTLQEIDL